MSNVLEWLKQRRVWVVIMMALSAGLKLFGVEFSDEQQTAIVDQTMVIVSLVPDLIAAILALWSYVSPKPKP